MFKKMILFCFLAVFLNANTPKDTIIIAQENESARLNPAFSEDHDGTIAMIFSGLTRFDENEKLVGDLAKSWKISDDGLEYTFYLRDDVLWHDGVKFSAKDVKFSIEAYLNEKNNSTLAVNFKDIKEIKIINDYEIKFTLNRAFPALLDAFSEGIIPEHILKNEDLTKTSFNQKPIGTGAYKLVEWKKGQFFRLKANENYHLAMVKTPNLIIQIINEPQIVATQLKAGKLDAGLIDGSLIKSFENDKNFQILSYKSADYRALMFGLNNEFLKDKRVRLALNYAVNKKSIVENLLHNKGFVANHPLQMSWANAEIKGFEYDLKKAENLLSEAGFSKNENGMWQKDNKELGFEIYAMSNDPLRVALASILQSDFAKLGVKTKVVAKVSGSFDYTKIDGFIVGWGSPFDPDFHTYRVFASSQDTSENPAGWNYGHYKNELVDKALMNARNSLNLDERKKFYKDFVQELQNDPPFIFLAYLEFSLVANQNLKGIKPRVLGHHGVGFTHNIYEWYK